MKLENLSNMKEKMVKYKEDIDKLSIKKFETVIFDLTDNLGKIYK